MHVRNLPRLSVLRFLVFYIVIHIIMYISGPSLLIESTDSMISFVVGDLKGVPSKIAIKVAQMGEGLTFEV